MTDSKPYLPIPCMPDGKPAPFVLTEEEAIQFLRVEARFPHDTITYYREKAGLRAVQIGRNVRYRLDDLLAFLDAQQERNPR